MPLHQRMDKENGERQIHSWACGWLSPVMGLLGPNSGAEHALNTEPSLQPLKPIVLAMFSTLNLNSFCLHVCLLIYSLRIVLPLQSELAWYLLCRPGLSLIGTGSTDVSHHAGLGWNHEHMPFLQDISFEDMTMQTKFMKKQRLKFLFHYFHSLSRSIHLFIVSLHIPLKKVIQIN